MEELAKKLAKALFHYTTHDVEYPYLPVGEWPLERHDAYLNLMNEVTNVLTEAKDRFGDLRRL